MRDFKHPSYQLSEVLRQIYNSRLTTTSGGNISIMGDNEEIWITPGAVDKGTLTEKDMVKVYPDGRFEGLHKPSSELPFHRAIYKIRPEIKAIIHAHPPALVAFSIVRKIPNTSIISQAKNLCGNIGYAPYEMPGSRALGINIADEFKKGFNAVIMENHGTVVGGNDLSDAFMRFETLEFCSRTIIKAQMIGDIYTLTAGEIKQFEDYNSNLLEFEHANPSNDELLNRHKMIEIIKRACKQGLMISSYGTISTRVNKNEFIINPTNYNRRDIQTHDLVLIKDGKRESGKHPSRAVKIHYKIYSKHEEIQCIISTQSPFATAFCVTHTELDTRTIPESYVLLEDIPLLPFESILDDGVMIADRLGKHTPIVLLENDSILVTGGSLIETFDRLEVAEFSSKSLIDSTSIGKLQPIKNEELLDLRKKFLND